MNARLQFDEATHTYTVDGEKWPSVTTILDPLLELDGIPRAALEAAAQFGSHVHMATDLWDKGQLDEGALDPHLQPYLAGWKAFLRESGAVVVASEVRVSHRLLKIAGTLDKVVGWKLNRLYILDVKSGADVPWTVGMQTAGYRELYIDQFGLDSSRLPLMDPYQDCLGIMPEERAQRDRDAIRDGSNYPHLSTKARTLSATRLCVHLKPEGVYKLHVLDDSRDRNDFISAVNFHNMRKRRGR